MFQAKLKVGHAQDLAAILSSLPPKDLTDIKTLRSVLKISDKCEAVTKDIQKVQEEMEVKMKPYRERLSEMEDDKEKQELNKEANKLALPFVDRLNELRDVETEVEFSDDQTTLIRNSFFKLIASNLRNVRYAMEIADRLEVPDEEGK